VNWAIINKERETAITIHSVDAGLDSGNILFQEFIEVGPNAFVTELYDRLNEIQRRALGAVVERFLEGDRGRPQEGPCSYCCTRVPDDGEISCNAPTLDIYALIRALAKPYDGAFTFLHRQRVTIVHALPVPDAPHYVGRIPGRVCGIDRKSGAVDVLTGDGILRIYEIEGSEGIRRTAASTIRSTKETLGLPVRELLEDVERLQGIVERLIHVDASATIPGHSRLDGSS
jgi:methionyl-tRNA formyltransferase